MTRIFCVIFLFSLQAHAKTFLPKTFQIKFTKELQSILKKKKKSEGTLSYQYPSKIRIEQLRPFKTVYVSDGTQAWLYSAPLDPQKERGEVTLLDSRKVPIARVLDGLRGGLKSNKMYQVSREGKMWTLTFNAKSREKYQVSSVVIEMNHPQAKSFKQIKTLTIVGKNSTEKYQLVDVDLSPSLAPQHFTFKVTKGMKVTEGH